MIHNRFTRRTGAWQRSKTAALQMAAVFVLACLTPTTHAGIEEGRVKAQACVACHGADGNSAMPGTPSIAGQPRQFIVTALYMFREGRRKNDLMAPFVDKLTNADLNDLAAFFASQKMAPPTHTTTPERIAQGKALTQQNNCVACHTANLTGQQHIPRVASQRHEYLLGQLKLFRAGARGDFDGTMTSATQALTQNDIEILADYLASLGAP